MRPFTGFLKMLTPDELEKLHDSAASLLENPGMKIENSALLGSLSKAGAEVDFAAEVARIPKKLTDEIIALAAAEEKERMVAIAGNDFSETDIENKLTYSWHSPFRNRGPKIEASFGGGAPLFYDHQKGINRYATRDDFLNMINLAQALPEIVTVGNAVHYIRENDGSNVAPKMVAIKGAALVAKHSSKPGCTTIIDRRQLPYLMEMGRIVKGSASQYVKSPVFVNIHDTESPLRLTRPEAAIIEAMAKNGLCISILPMPLIGISTPIFPVSAAIVGAAEILAVWAAVKSFNSNCPVEANCVSGVLNPSTGTACFAAPEAVMADLAVGQLFREKFGVPCGLGVGLIDAPVPGLLSVYERIFKSTASTLAGEPSFPVGIIGGAVVFSMEQVILDLEIAANQRQLIKGIGQEHFGSSLELIREKGIGGLFIDTQHTAANFRDNLTFRHALVNLKSTSVSDTLAKDPVEAAHNRCLELLENVRPYLIDEVRERAIDEVANRASRELSGLTGAME